MNTCKTCKWWGPPNSFVDKSIRVRTCNQFEGGLHSLDLVAVTDSGMGDAPTTLYTGPDFGCIHYEETQEQLPQEHPGYTAKLAGDNEAAVTLPTGTDTSLRREIESALKSGHHVFLKA